MRDSHGLFDYESRSINKKSLKTHTPGKIVRFKQDIDLEPIVKKKEGEVEKPKPVEPIDKDQEPKDVPEDLLEITQE